MMNRHVAVCIQVQHFFAELFGQGMNLVPIFIVLPVFQNSQIDIRKFFTNLLKMFTLAAISANPNGTLWRLEYKRRPQRFIRRYPTTRKMPCRSRGHVKAFAQIG